MPKARSYNYVAAVHMIALVFYLHYLYHLLAYYTVYFKPYSPPSKHEFLIWEWKRLCNLCCCVMPSLTGFNSVLAGRQAGNSCSKQGRNAP